MTAAAVAGQQQFCRARSQHIIVCHLDNTKCYFQRGESGMYPYIYIQRESHSVNERVGMGVGGMGGLL